VNSSVWTDPETFRSTAADADDETRVPVEVRTTVADPFEAYRRARNDGDGVFLETSGGQSGWSYFGIDPVQRLQVGPEAVVIDGDSKPVITSVPHRRWRRLKEC
jgi:aminodeoxychorismate synthase, subunit I (EC 6.3.5.8)